ncbi:unnamed protein product [Symbiodinium natans]|uniref:Uncharacterized protein n=1 Tax=Symbiodinium natans TaxID=878477 RepID=A0A812QIJ4_9DINO|nr:unnamed protein product [Symbiodinium natans]
MNSLDFESEESSTPRHEASCWRRLPTALFHMLVVECIHIYLAVFAWFRLVTNVNLRTAMGAHFQVLDRLEGYFYNLFLFGSTAGTSVHLSNVTDTFFLGQEQRTQPSVFYNGSMLELPSTNIDGANIPWIVLVWLLPLGGALLVLLHLVLLARRRVWSFDCGAYLQFSWDIVRTPEYRWSVGLMALAAILLPIIWILQILIFNLPDQLDVLRGSILSGLLLLFALDQLAFPSIPCHDWASPFQDLTFRRPMLHLILGTNKSFGLKLVDALWAAELGDLSRLRRYLPDPDNAEEVLRICREVQRAEADMLGRFRLQAGSE